MRLIDADVLKEKFLDMGCLDDKPCYGAEILDRMPTVDVLDKIRAEIEQNKNRDIGGNCEQWVNGYRVGMNEALVIIDNYTAESEDKG